MTYKRGKVYWYKFMWDRRLVRESTRQGSDKVARSMESAHRTSLAKGEVGIRERRPIPTLKEFINQRVDPWARTTYSPDTYVRWFRPGSRAICAYQPLASRALDQTTGEHIAGFAAHRQAKGLQVSSVNSALRVLRRVLGLAVEWGALAGVPKVRLLRGERRRDRVVSPEEEMRYLAAAPQPLASIAAVLFDTGLRSNECRSLCWEYISLNGRNGVLQVASGKSAAARRLVPMTPRVRSVLWSLWLKAGKPETGYVWPAETRAGYVHDETLRRMHVQALKDSGVRHFVLHSLRHTFMTRLGATGIDPWTLARVVGHSSVKEAMRYMHPSDDGAARAISQLPTTVLPLLPGA